MKLGSISFQTRQLCFSIFSFRSDIIKSHPFLPWLKSASAPILPGTIQFILQISAQTILPAWHYFPDNSESPPTRILPYIFICHYLFIISPIQLWATWSQRRYFTHLCISITWHGMWSELVLNTFFFEWTNKSKITRGHICHIVFVSSETLIQPSTQGMK